MNDIRDNPALSVEAYTRSSVEQPFTIAAGGIFTLNAYGVAFYVTDCTGPVKILTDQTSPKTYKKGQGEEFPDQLRFKRIEIRNDNAAAVSGRIWVGFGRFIDSRFEVLESFTKLIGNATEEILNGASVVLTGIPPAGCIQRKAIVVSNEDANGKLIVRDAGGLKCAVVFPETSITLPIAGEVEISNESGGDIECGIGEIWYAPAP